MADAASSTEAVVVRLVEGISVRGVLGTTERVIGPCMVRSVVRIPSVLTLLPQLCLSDRLRYAGVAAGVALTEHASAASASEELLRRHHHLLVVATATWRLPLVD